MNGRARELLLGPMHVERGRILLMQGIRTGIVAIVILAGVLTWGRDEYALPMTISAVFVAIADAGESVGRRWRTMLWTTTWLMACTLLGSLAGDYVIPGLIAVTIVAFICGAAGMLGARAAVAGLLALVMFIIFAGAPDSDRGISYSVLAVGLGGVIMTAVTVLPKAFNAQARARAAAPVPSLRSRIAGNTDRDNDFIRHGIRLAIMILIASTISAVTTWPHDYWLPMSVAWVTRPDAQGTATKLIARIAGTIAGSLIVAVLVDGLHAGPMAVAIAAGMASGVAAAFIWANYAIAITGVTVLVVGLLSFDGDPLLETMGLRIGLTIAAAALALCGFILWPPSSHRAKAVSHRT